MTASTMARRLPAFVLFAASLGSAPILDGASQVIERTGYVPQGIVEEDGRVYVLTTVTDFVALYRATLDGSEPKLVLMNDGTDVQSCLAVNATHVIWTKSIPGTNEFAIYAWPKGASAGDEVLVAEGEGSCVSASANQNTLFLSRRAEQGDYNVLETYDLPAAE